MIYHHLFWEITRPGTAALAIDGFPLPWLAALSNGWLGVNVFFVLSGFVLVLPYARGARTMKTLGDWKDFYVRRWLRLMPFYYFSLLIAFAFMHHLEPGDRLFMVDAVVMGTATFNLVERLYFPPYNWVLWSLGIEIWFSCVSQSHHGLTHRAAR